MKKLYLFYTLLIAFCFSASAQLEVFTAKSILPHQQNTKAGTMALCDTNISFNNGINNSSIGAGTNTWEAGIYFDTVQTKFFGDTALLEAVQFYITDTVVFSQLRLRIYEGSSISGEVLGSTLTNGAIIFDSIIPKQNINLNEFTTISLDSALLIDKTMGYTIFLQIVQTTSGFPVGVSAGPMVLGRGGWIGFASYQQMIEANASLDYNWMINACLSGDIIIPDYNIELAGGVFNPTGYEKLPQDQIKSTGYSFQTNVRNLGADTATGVMSYFSIDGNVKDTLNHGTLLPNQSVNRTSNATLLDTAIGIHNVRMDCYMDSVDFNPSDNKAFGRYEITDSVYSRTSRSTFFITGEGMMGNVYDIQKNTVITRSIVSLYNDDDFTIPSDYGMYVALFNVNPANGTVDAFPMAVSDTVFVPDSFALAANQNRAYPVDFIFSSPLEVFEGQRILVAFSNPTVGVRRYDEPPVYQNVSCFTGVVDGTGNYSFSENSGRYYVIDVVLNSSLFGNLESIANNIKNDITVYPNPTNGLLTINNLEGYNEVEVLSVTGSKVYNTEFNKSSLQLNLTSLHPGMYFINLKGAQKETVIKKVIIE